MTHTEIIKELERIVAKSGLDKAESEASQADWIKFDIRSLISRIQEDEDRMSEEMAKENV